MNFAETVLLALSVSMDAFAVALCKGMHLRRVTVTAALTVGIWFGVFQAGMPTLGYILGAAFEKHIRLVDHYVAFFLLCFIGGHMIYDAFFTKEDIDGGLSAKVMFPAALATSVDALAVGVPFAFFLTPQGVIAAVSCIGGITCMLCAVGVKLGSICGNAGGRYATVGGGVVLILLGMKILVQHIFL